LVNLASEERKMNDLFDNATYLRDRGIKRSKQNADVQIDQWSEKAFTFLKEFISLAEYPFMAEDVRNHPDCTVPEPPSKRAWGAILVRAAKLGLIRRVGYRETKNPWAHRTPATLWEAT
jgi:hypothetical protein